MRNALSAIRATEDLLRDADEQQRAASETRTRRSLRRRRARNGAESENALAVEQHEC